VARRRRPASSNVLRTDFVVVADEGRARARGVDVVVVDVAWTPRSGRGVDNNKFETVPDASTVAALTSRRWRRAIRVRAYDGAVAGAFPHVSATR
jgi:hypothetical protein